MKMKKLLGIGALVACLSLSPISTFAASSVSGYCGLISCYGSVSFGTDSASAYTSASSSQLACTASVLYKYGFGTSTYQVSSNSSANSNYVNAYVNANHYSVRNLGAIGQHGVYSGASSWSDTTTIGSF